MSQLENIMKIIEQSTFCYASKEGQGYVNKNQCECSQKESGICCSAYLEKEQFHKEYRELEAKGMDRPEIIAELKRRSDWSQSSWIQYNVEE